VAGRSDLPLTSDVRCRSDESIPVEVEVRQVFARAVSSIAIMDTIRTRRTRSPSTSWPLERRPRVVLRHHRHAL